MEEFITSSVSFACALALGVFSLVLNTKLNPGVPKVTSYLLIWLSIFFAVLLLWKMFIIVGEY